VTNILGIVRRPFIIRKHNILLTLVFITRTRSYFKAVIFNIIGKVNSLLYFILEFSRHNRKERRSYYLNEVLYLVFSVRDDTS
jgi:hypothetical protein